jgi:hypothetical protein
VTASKPSPMPPTQPAPAKPPAKAAQPARAAISRSDLQREIRKAVEKALRAQARQSQPVEVKVKPPEITVRVVKEEPSSVAPPPRRERLSDRELERRFKERLLQQEP